MENLLPAKQNISLFYEAKERPENLNYFMSQASMPGMPLEYVTRIGDDWNL